MYPVLAHPVFLFGFFLVSFWFLFGVFWNRGACGAGSNGSLVGVAGM
jgi:hypothetical protein